MKKSKLRRIGNCISQLGNVILLNGDEDETISSQIGKAKTSNNGRMPKPHNSATWWMYWIHAILIRVPGLKGHFINAIELDEGKPL